MTAITANSFDPRAEVFLPASEKNLVTVSNATSCTLSNVRFAQNQVEASVQAATPSLVVLSQTFYHLWQAEVDGQRVLLLRANLAFQAVQIPAGEHELKLIYRDRNLVIGAGISVFSILICVGIWRRSPPLEKLDRASRHD